MEALKDIWTKKGFNFRIKDNYNFVAKRVNEYINGKKCNWNKKYYFIENGFIFDKASKKIVDMI